MGEEIEKGKVWPIADAILGKGDSGQMRQSGDEICRNGWRLHKKVSFFPLTESTNTRRIAPQNF
jgi:hypothetical protein